MKISDFSKRFLLLSGGVLVLTYCLYSTMRIQQLEARLADAQRVTRVSVSTETGSSPLIIWSSDETVQPVRPIEATQRPASGSESQRNRSGIVPEMSGDKGLYDFRIPQVVQ